MRNRPVITAVAIVGAILVGGIIYLSSDSEGPSLRVVSASHQPSAGGGAQGGEPSGERREFVALDSEFSLLCSIGEVNPSDSLPAIEEAVGMQAGFARVRGAMRSVPPTESSAARIEITGSIPSFMGDVLRLVGYDRARMHHVNIALEDHLGTVDSGTPLSLSTDGSFEFDYTQSGDTPLEFDVEPTAEQWKLISRIGEPRLTLVTTTVTAEQSGAGSAGVASLPVTSDFAVICR